MRIDNQFTVPASPERAWEFLTDLERVAPCLPGATVESMEGDVLAGRVAIRIGPIGMAYAGEARFVVRDDENKVATIQAGGRDPRGGGTVAARIRASLVEDPAGSRVDLSTELDLTGRVAQLGQGPINEVSARLMDQFVACLAERIGAEPGTSPPDDRTAASAEPIDLLSGSVLPIRSLVLLAGGIAALVAAVLLGRRLRRRRVR